MTLARNVFGALDSSARSSYRNDPAVGFEAVTRTFAELRASAARRSR